MSKKPRITERFVGSYKVPGAFSLKFRAFLKRRLPWVQSLGRKKPKKKMSPPFSGSSIVARPFSNQKRGRVGLGSRKTKSGKVYVNEYTALRRDLGKQDLSKERVSTIMAFCKNYYIKHNDLPLMDDLRKLFKF